MILSGIRSDILVFHMVSVSNSIDNHLGFWMSSKSISGHDMVSQLIGEPLYWYR